MNAGMHWPMPMPRYHDTLGTKLTSALIWCNAVLVLTMTVSISPGAKFEIGRHLGHVREQLHEVQILSSPRLLHWPNTNASC